MKRLVFEQGSERMPIILAGSPPSILIFSSCFSFLFIVATLRTDIKYGAGYFQTTFADAEALAQSMVHTGEANGLHPTTAFLTRHDQPIGTAVGNWLEVRECLEILRGNCISPLQHDLVTLTVVQSAQMLYQSKGGNTESFEVLVEKVGTALRDGTALAQFRRMVQAQGGDVRVVDDPAYEPHTAARHSQSVKATASGYLSAMNARTVGQVSVLLGAGRRAKEDAVDPAAGILLHAKMGSAVREGDCIAELFTNLDKHVLETAAERFQACLAYSSEPVTLPPVISHRITQKHETEEFVMPELCFLEELLRRPN